MQVDHEDHLSSHEAPSFEDRLVSAVFLTVEVLLAGLGWLGLLLTVVLADFLADPKSNEVTLSAGSMQRLLTGSLIAGVIWY